MNVILSLAVSAGPVSVAARQIASVAKTGVNRHNEGVDVTLMNGAVYSVPGSGAYQDVLDRLAVAGFTVA